ncbi:TIGR03759 family integrating conjugative element protein [Erwinia psidii]|uniref:TIGR03759 family integrating conjugative element protein n=1 Tax=Erwinia psidii TaxID=69224 RepID=UPI00226B6319|nr:TIGR03759 family integrating conjugative element protein [Erwinia psidii]MCX8967266.1 TIGR03759 family integrating conjugative element protein [Erwinia psidii]
MKLRKTILLALLFSSLVQAEVQVVNSKGQPVDENAQALQDSGVQGLQQQAGRWGLSVQDWQRYQQLMKGPRGIQSPGLDPLSALGIEAQSPAERRQYAEKWVRAEFDRTQKELDFQREVNAAWQRLYPGALPVNMGNAAGVAHDSGGRLALFVRASGCTTCDARLSAVLADNRPVDIYLVDSQGSDEALRRWARDHHIAAEKVRAHQITLNHDGGRWLRFGNGLMPVLLQQGGDGSWAVAAF